MEITIQPLISALKGKEFYYRLSIKDDNYILDLGTKLTTRSLANRKLDMIAGTELVSPEITYVINNTGYTKSGSSITIPQSTLIEVEKIVNQVFNFRDNHHVTVWKD